MKPRKGFTLVELLIVVLILGVLAAISVPRILGGATSAKVNACKANVGQINSQIEIYRPGSAGTPWPDGANKDAWPSSLTDITGNTDPGSAARRGLTAISPMVPLNVHLGRLITLIQLPIGLTRTAISDE